LHKTIYGQNSPYLKYSSFYRAFGLDKSLFATWDTTLHKTHRSKLNPFFSHSSILKIQGLITSSLLDLSQRLDQRGYDKEVNLYHLCRCLPADVITKYACNRSASAILNSDADFNAPILEAFDATASTTWARAYFPTMTRLQDLLPLEVAARFSKDVRKIKGFLDFAVDSYKAYRTTTPVGEPPGGKMPEHAVPFDGLKDLPLDEAIATSAAVIAGGSDTTGYTLTFACWQVCRNAEVRERLVGEVDRVFEEAEGGMPGLAELERLPYLGAVVKEALRLGMATPGRLPRVVPSHSNSNSKTGPLVVDGKVIPPGTIVGMSPYTMHRSQELWGPDAEGFRPERWLGDDAKVLASNLVAFSRGHRNCIGQNLAVAELHFATAFLFRRYEIELVDEKAEWRYVDRFTALVPAGVYVRIKPRHRT
jgi:cytochrome P450